MSCGSCMASKFKLLIGISLIVAGCVAADENKYKAMKRVDKGSLEEVSNSTNHKHSASALKITWLPNNDKVCIAQGGATENGACYAEWSEAKNICRKMGGRLPSIEELREVVDSCGGINVTKVDEDWDPRIQENYTNIDKNYANDDYQSCRKAQGFIFEKYWSSSMQAYSTVNAWVVSFDAGYTLYYGTSYNFYVRCVR